MVLPRGSREVLRSDATVCHAYEHKPSQRLDLDRNASSVFALEPTAANIVGGCCDGL